MITDVVPPPDATLKSPPPVLRRDIPAHRTIRKSQRGGGADSFRYIRDTSAGRRREIASNGAFRDSQIRRVVRNASTKYSGPVRHRESGDGDRRSWRRTENPVVPAGVAADREQVGTGAGDGEVSGEIGKDAS